jgi:cation transport ATPase
VPEDAHEVFGRGVRALVDRHDVVVGSAGWLREEGIEIADGPSVDPGAAKVLVGIDGRHAGVLFVVDKLRSDSNELVPRLRAAGVHHVALVTGDKRAVAEATGEILGVDRVYSEQTPSLVAMGVAAAGYLLPVQGALLQEAIDVGVIANSLRALRG